MKALSSLTNQDHPRFTSLPFPDLDIAVYQIQVLQICRHQFHNPDTSVQQSQEDCPVSGSTKGVLITGPYQLGDFPNWSGFSRDVWNFWGAYLPDRVFPPFWFSLLFKEVQKSPNGPVVTVPPTRIVVCLFQEEEKEPQVMGVNILEAGQFFFKAPIHKGG